MVNRPTGPLLRCSESGEVWQRIGTEYLDAPMLPRLERDTDRVLRLWQEFATELNCQVRSIRRTVNVIEVDLDEPYVSSQAQSDDIDRGRFYVSTTNCNHPVWTKEQNISFRIWHDLVGHHAHRLGFDRFGELAVYAATCKLVEPRCQAVLFVEVLAQTAAAVLCGAFPVQKAYLPRTFALLHGARS